MSSVVDQLNRKPVVALAVGLVLYGLVRRFV